MSNAFKSVRQILQNTLVGATVELEDGRTGIIETMGVDDDGRPCMILKPEGDFWGYRWDDRQFTMSYVKRLTRP